MKNYMTLMLLVFSFLSASLYAQQDFKTEIRGRVTFISSQNVYVSFDNTEGINEKDTLFYLRNGQKLPAIQVKYRSERSCAGPPLQGFTPSEGMQIIAMVRASGNKPESISIIREALNNNEPKLMEKEKTAAVTESPSGYEGRFSLQSYSSLSGRGGEENSQRWRYTAAGKIRKIMGSRFSFSEFFTFTYRPGEQGESLLKRGLRAYDLALSFQATPSSALYLGRHTNLRISSIGPSDGLQYEKEWKKFFSGALAGFRPDFGNSGFNANLFQYGGYIGRNDSLGTGSMENTLAAFQQMYNGKTDRRFIYYQHTNEFLRNAYIFISSEFDLFSKENGRGKSDLDFTSLFLMSRYSPSSALSFSLSYDARKDVIYYETFQNPADSIFERETRQGLNAGINIRPLSGLYLGLNSGYRKSRKDEKASVNYGGYISYAALPFIKASPSLNFHRIESSFIEGTALGLSFSGSPFNDIIFSSLGFRRVSYTFKGTSSSLKQDILSIDLSTRIFRKAHLTIGYEGTFEDKSTYNRILLDLSYRMR